MNRRSLIQACIAAPLTTLSPAAWAQTRPPMRTIWRVEGSEGQDAIAFLGPLSGRTIYTDHYAEDVALFAPRLPERVHISVPALWASAEANGFGLLSPQLALFLSHADADATIDDLLAALADPECHIRPALEAGTYWDAENWAWFTAHAGAIAEILQAMKSGGFAAFHAERSAAALEAGLLRLRSGLGVYDVTRVQERITGQAFAPTIDITLLQFCKPHGIKVKGQRFLQSPDYDVATTVRIAAHEMLHPPVDMDGPAALAALEALGRDALVARIVAEHDPRWGYTTLPGLLNEDLCQALDQMISEVLGVARNAADRWRTTDDGIHVLAAGLYGLLREDRWNRTGGSIEAWLLQTAAQGRLAPPILHAAAARVLERPEDQLWPLAADA